MRSPLNSFVALALPYLLGTTLAHQPRSPPPRHTRFGTTSTDRRRALDTFSAIAVGSTSSSLWCPWASSAAVAEDVSSTATVDLPPVLVQVGGDAKKLFNEGRAYESQGNMFAAQRAYNKVTLIAPRFVYGWSNLGNTQTALGDLDAADASYSKSIDLCLESQDDTTSNGRKCSDLYILLLNRGSLRLNNGQPKEALQDLARSDSLRGRPDALVLQNLARAKELNGQYASADRDYAMAIGLSSNEVNPFWLRAALVKYQLGDLKGAYDLFQRVENRFPEAPEVRAAYAVLLTAKGDPTGGRQQFLSIPDRQRLKYSDVEYVTKVIAWPPAMQSGLDQIRKAVGDVASQ